MAPRADLARRRWIGDAVAHALTLDGPVAERAQAGMVWVNCGVERGDTGIGVRTMARAHREWDAWLAEVVRQIEATPPETAKLMYEQRRLVEQLHVTVRVEGCGCKFCGAAASRRVEL